MPLLLRTLLFFAPAIIWSNANGQCPGCGVDLTCTVSPAYPTLCPVQPPDATVGQPYQADLTFWMPDNFDDPGSGQNVDFEQMTITGITGLPFGLEIETSNPVGIYYPQLNQFGCARICGTPLGAGTYTIVIDIIATVEVTSIGITVNAPQSFPITLVVLPGSGGNSSFSFAPSTGCGTAEVQFEALIDGDGQPTSYDWDFGNGSTAADMIPPPQTYGTPGTYTVSLTTTIGGYVLNSVILDGVNDNWCGDVEEPYVFGCTLAPDLYFVLTDGGGGQYTSSSGSDSESENWTGLELLLNDPPYSIQFLDEDPISADDDLGTYNIPLGGAGIYPFVIAGGTNGSLQVDLTTQLTFSDTDSVTVFPLPSITVAYDSAASQICANDTTVISYTWFNDGDTVPGATGPCVPADSAGLWWAVGMNGFGCASTSDTVTVCSELEILEADVVLYVLGDYDSYQWYFNGVPIPGETGPVLLPGLPGIYSIGVTTAYGCPLSAEINYLTTGLANAGTGCAFQVVPVPNDGSFTLIASGLPQDEAILTVMDERARIVLERWMFPSNGQAALRIDRPDLAAGHYTIIISGTGWRDAQAFVVQH